MAGGSSNNGASVSLTGSNVTGATANLSESDSHSLDIHIAAPVIALAGGEVDSFDIANLELHVLGVGLGVTISYDPGTNAVTFSGSGGVVLNGEGSISLDLDDYDVNTDGNLFLTLETGGGVSALGLGAGAGLHATIDDGQLVVGGNLDVVMLGLMGERIVLQPDTPSGPTIGSNYTFIAEVTSRALIGNSGDLQSLNATIDDLAAWYPAIVTNPEFLSRVGPALQALGGQEAWGQFIANHLNDSCFGPEVPIDMWPLDSDLKPGPDGIYDQDEVRAKVWKKPIKLIQVGDLVVSFDDDGNLVPGPVTRTFQNNAKILLNFHGTPVTPGHVYYRPDSKKSYKYETLIDVLRDDGVIQKQDGTLIRAATNVPVDSPRDGFVRAVAGKRKADGTFAETDEGRIRLGTRFLVGTGKERKSFAVADLIEHGGGVVGDELIRVGDGAPMPFLWDFGETLPKPEDFVLACSGTTLEDIYKAAEWESQGPRLPAPMVLDRGPVQPLKGAALSDMPRNEPLNVAHSPLAPAKPQRALNRKQRKARAAKQRKTANSHTRIVG